MPVCSPTVRFDRVSSVDQRDGFSLASQQTLGEKYAKENNLRVMKSWSVDESASKEDERKHFFEMVEFVKNNKIKDVVFDKVDRACRGLKSAVVIEELIDRFGVKFHFTREHLIIDRDSPPQEKLRFYLGTILGKYYIDNLKTEINKGLVARRDAGLWNSKAPFGYKNVRLGSSNKAEVIPDPEISPIVKEIFELYATGNYSYEYFVNLLKSRFPERAVTKRVFEELLKNPFYYGDMRIKGDLIVKGAHEPLISKSLWSACQKIRGIRAVRNQTPRTRDIPKPFMNFLTCGTCGHAVTGEVHRKASGKVYVYYHCANHSCPERKINTPQEHLFEQITQAFDPFIRFSPKATEAFISSLEGRLEELELYTQKATGELAQQRLEIKENIFKLEQLHRDGVLNEKEFKEVMEIKTTALQEVKIEIDAHNEADHKTFKEGLRIIELLVKVHDFMNLEGQELERVRLAKLVLSNPILTNRTLQFSYQKPFDVLIELTTSKIWWSRWELNPRPKKILRPILQV